MSGISIRRIVVDDSMIMYFDAANSSYINVAPGTSSVQGSLGALGVQYPTFSGTIPSDLSKNAGYSTIANSTTYTTFGGGSYYFTGTEYMNTSYSQLNVPYVGKTIMCCAYIPEGGFNAGLQGLPNYGFRALFAKPNSTGTPVGQNIGRNWNFYIYDDNTGNGYQYHFSCYASAGLSGYLPKTGDNAVDGGRWFVGAFTQDSLGLSSFYHNGVLMATYSGQLIQYINHTIDGERIGASGTNAIGYNGGAFWKGCISTVLIYSRCLTADEIKQNYNVYSYRYNLPKI